MVASWSQATVFLASYVRKSQERNGKNEFLLTSFCHWLISRPRVCGRKLEVHMHISSRMHDYSCNMPHTLMGYTH